ncbi:Ig kappa chain V-V region MOPC 173B [Heterocephalus glaber]|nr:Ig kappa chain V-V region MOPC 173B [Heterocephalus glaber]
MNMRASTQLLRLLLLLLPGARCPRQMTKSPNSLPAPLGNTVTITCQASEDVRKYLCWYQKKLGKALKLLIYDSINLQSGAHQDTVAVDLSTLLSHHQWCGG